MIGSEGSARSIRRRSDRIVWTDKLQCDKLECVKTKAKFIGLMQSPIQEDRRELYLTGAGVLTRGMIEALGGIIPAEELAKAVSARHNWNESGCDDDHLQRWSHSRAE